MGGFIPQASKLFDYMWRYWGE